MHITAPTDKIAEKIRKLLALAERAGTPEEAGTAFAQAQKLMTAHAISEAQIRAAATREGISADEPIISRVVWTRPGRQVPTWLGIVVRAISEVNGCAPICGSRSETASIKAWGTSSGLDAVASLVGPIVGQIDALTRRSGFSGRTALNNFRLGAAQTVARRLREAQAAMLAETRALHAAEVGVVAEVTAIAIRQVEGALQVADRKMRSDVRVVARRSSSCTVDADAREAGRAAGERIGISGQRALTPR